MGTPETRSIFSRLWRWAYAFLRRLASQQLVDLQNTRDIRDRITAADRAEASRLRNAYAQQRSLEKMDRVSGVPNQESAIGDIEMSDMSETQLQAIADDEAAEMADLERQQAQLARQTERRAQRIFQEMAEQKANEMEARVRAGETAGAIDELAPLPTAGGGAYAGIYTYDEIQDYEAGRSAGTRTYDANIERQLARHTYTPEEIYQYQSGSGAVNPYIEMQIDQERRDRAARDAGGDGSRRRGHR